MYKLDLSADVELKQFPLHDTIPARTLPSNSVDLVHIDDTWGSFPGFLEQIPHPGSSQT